MDLRPSTNSYRQWFRERSTPEQMRIVITALDCFDRICENKTLSAEDIRPLIDAVRSRFKEVWEVGSHLISVLTPDHAVARQAVYDLLQSDDWNHRLRAIVAARGFRILLIDVLASTLQDRSRKVRELAIMKQRLGNLPELLPQLEASLKSEPDETLRLEILHNIGLHRDGFALKPINDNLLSLEVHTKLGTISMAIEKRDATGPSLHAAIERLRSAGDQQSRRSSNPSPD